MQKNTKIWLVIGLFIIAGIIAFAIYKGIGSSKDITTTTGGGSTTTTLGGAGDFFKSFLSLFN